MKRLLSFLLIFALLLSLSACGGYEPVESTEEEARTVMTLTLDGKTYEVRYELYRAMFLTYKESVDGGDDSVWSGENSRKYVEAIHSMIVARITDVYAVFHLCDKVGINLYSSSIENQIKDYIKDGVEGGIYGGESVGGHATYEDYLKALARLGHNYSTQVLILRYSIAINLLTEYYAGTIKDATLDDSLVGGALTFTKEDVKEFYEGDDSVRVMSAFVQSKYYGALGRAESLRAKMISSAGNDDAVAQTIGSNSMSVNQDVKRGIVIGRHSLDEENYGAMTEAAFSTAVGSVSDIVTITAGDSYHQGYYILYRVDKSDEHFEECYDEIASVYVENEIGRLLYDIQCALTESATASELLSSLDYSKITYPTVNLD